MVTEILSFFGETKTGIYNGHPRGFTTNEKGEEVGFTTESYSASEVSCLFFFFALTKYNKFFLGKSSFIKLLFKLFLILL